MRFMSVASGISAETLAWSPLGFEAMSYAQFDPDHNYKRGPDFASAVLAHHYPNTPNYGDMEKFEEWPDHAALDVLAGGTPCQTFSFAGLGAGLDDARGNLALVYAAIARRYRPRWILWENTGGVLSNDKGRAFATILGLLSGNRIEVPSGGWRSAGIVPGLSRAYGLAWRVLDTQFVRIHGFGRAIPQRRRRVFVIGYLGDWRRAAAVLFEREGLLGNPPPSRWPGQDVAGTLTRSFGVRCGVDEGERGTLIPEIANPLTARMGNGVNTTMDEWQTMIPAPVAPPLNAGNAQTGGGRRPGTSADDHEQLIPIAFNARQDPDSSEGVSGPFDADGYTHAVAAPLTAGSYNVGGRRKEDDHNLVAQPIPFDTTQLTNKDNRAQAIVTGWSVRRLMPIECERLQGFPDGFTLIPWRGKMASDGVRYKCLGNAQSVNVMRWIGWRIKQVDTIP